MNSGSNSDATEKFRKGADFLFGILIAVSLEKAVEGFLHIIVPSWGAEAVHNHEANLPAGCGWALALFRLLVFGALIANFYFGSIKFFEETYGSPPSSKPGEFGWRFRIDVFCGLTHFALFYAWSLSLTAVEPITLPFCEVKMTPFLLMLLAVLAYDVPWLGVRCLLTRWRKTGDEPDDRDKDTWKKRDRIAHGHIGGWTWKNLIIVILVIWLAHVMVTHQVAVELAAGAAALVLNLWEFAGIVGQEPATAR